VFDFVGVYIPER